MPLFGKKKKAEDDKQEPAAESEQNGSGISLDNLDLSDDNDIEANDEQASELSILDSALEGGLDDEDNEGETKGERREAKERRRRKMRVVGRSVRLLQEIIRRRAEKLRDKGRQS